MINDRSMMALRATAHSCLPQVVSYDEIKSAALRRGTHAAAHMPREPARESELHK